ncbi:hypothetical protein TNCV_1777941 [Trichonephila clavipes]|nr:hypothetical protein TNCV_1777941 [Trichonephila clavipes]
MYLLIQQNIHIEFQRIISILEYFCSTKASIITLNYVLSNEELDEEILAEGLDDNLEVEKLRFELDQTKEQLEFLKQSNARLQRELERKSE